MAESNDNVNETPEPEEISSEDVVGGQETPSATLSIANRRSSTRLPARARSSPPKRPRSRTPQRPRTTTSSSTSRKTRRRA